MAKDISQSATKAIDKAKATMHAARSKKNGEGFNLDHKDHEKTYDVNYADNIIPERCQYNSYLGVRYLENGEIEFYNRYEKDKQPLRASTNIRKNYEEHFQRSLDIQKEKYLAKAQKDYAQKCTVQHMLEDNHTRPEEMLFYLGDKNHVPDPNKDLEGYLAHAQLLLDIVKEQITWEAQTFPQVRYMNVCLHVDEKGAPHVETDRYYIGHDKDGIEIESQTQAFKEMGVKARDEDAALAIRLKSEAELKAWEQKHENIPKEEYDKAKSIAYQARRIMNKVLKDSGVSEKELKHFDEIDLEKQDLAKDHACKQLEISREELDKALDMTKDAKPKVRDGYTKMNNPKITHTEKCREHLHELCRERGLDIDFEPRDASEQGLSQVAYKTKQQEKAAQEAQQAKEQAEHDAEQLRANNTRMQAELQQKDEEIRKLKAEKAKEEQARDKAIQEKDQAIQDKTYAKEELDSIEARIEETKDIYTKQEAAVQQFEQISKATKDKEQEYDAMSQAIDRLLDNGYNKLIYTTPKPTLFNKHPEPELRQGLEIEVLRDGSSRLAGNVMVYGPELDTLKQDLEDVKAMAHAEHELNKHYHEREAALIEREKAVEQKEKTQDKTAHQQAAKDLSQAKRDKEYKTELGNMYAALLMDTYGTMPNPAASPSEYLEQSREYKQKMHDILSAKVWKLISQCTAPDGRDAKTWCREQMELEKQQMISKGKGYIQSYRTIDTSPKH